MGVGDGHDKMLAELVRRGWEFHYCRRPEYATHVELISPIAPESRRAEYVALWDAFRADKAAAKAAIHRYLQAGGAGHDR